MNRTPISSVTDWDTHSILSDMLGWLSYPLSFFFDHAPRFFRFEFAYIESWKRNLMGACVWFWKFSLSGIEPRSPVRQTRTKTIILTEMLICCSFLLLPLLVFSLVFIFLNMCTPKVESVVLWKLVFSSKSSLCRGIEPLSTTWQTGVFTTFLTEMLSWISFPPWFSLQSSATFSPGLNLLTSKIETVIWWKRVFGCKSSLCRGIEPRSPVWQTGILTTILTEMLDYFSFPFIF